MGLTVAGHKRPRFFYGWIIVAVVGLAGFTQSAGTFPVWGVLLKPITEDFGWSRSVFTAATSIGTVAAGLVSIGVGPLVDRFGARWTLVVSLTLLGTSLLLMANIHALWHFYTLQILGRIMTMGIIALALSIVIPKWFVAKRGRAVALSGIGMMGGGTLTPLYVQYLVSTWNWRIAVATSGLVIWVVSLIPSALFMRRQPEDMGLLPDGTSSATQTISLQEKGSSDKDTNRPMEISLTVRQVIRLRSFYLLTAAFSIVFLVGPGEALHLVPYFTDRGIASKDAVVILSVWAASGAVGALIFGFLAERFNIRRVSTINFTLVALGFIFLLGVKSTPLGILWALYKGGVGGAMLPLYQIIFADYYGRESLGSIRGIVWPAQMGANAIGPLGASVVYDITGSYFLVFLCFALLAFVAGILVWLAHPPEIPQSVDEDRSTSNPFYHPSKEAIPTN